MKIFMPSLIASLFFFLLTCSRLQTTNSGADDVGASQFTIKLDAIGSLAKKSLIELDTLTIELSENFTSRFVDKIAITGNTQQSITRTYSDLAPFKNWYARVTTSDKKGNLIHDGGTAFTVQPHDTTIVSLDLLPWYSMLRTRFYPIMDSVTSCRMWVDDKLVSDTVFPKTALRGDTVSLSYDYLSVNPINHKIRLEARGTMWGDDTLLYCIDTTISVVSGQNKNYAFTMKWVGSYAPPKGSLAMNINIGTMGNIDIGGELGGKVATPYITWNWMPSSIRTADCNPNYGLDHKLVYKYYSMEIASATCENSDATIWIKVNQYAWVPWSLTNPTRYINQCLEIEPDFIIYAYAALAGWRNSDTVVISKTSNKF